MLGWKGNLPMFSRLILIHLGEKIRIYLQVKIRDEAFILGKCKHKQK